MQPESTSLLETMARLPQGLVVISTRDGQGFRGLTATSFTSLSLEPPLVLVCLDELSLTGAALREHGAFNASVLARDHTFLAERFSGRAPAADRSWSEIPHRLGGNGLPILEGAPAWVECTVEAIHPGGDHEIVVGRVGACGIGAGDPLVLWDRALWGLQ
jgi:flavin reductase (DIM6/NTAB) family NADH-FMN oxidoreductase RutF